VSEGGPAQGEKMVRALHQPSPPTHEGRWLSERSSEARVAIDPYQSQRVARLSNGLAHPGIDVGATLRKERGLETRAELRKRRIRQRAPIGRGLVPSLISQRSEDDRTMDRNSAGGVGSSAGALGRSHAS